MIFSAIAKRSSALGGIPFSSSVRQTTAAPYLAMSGRIRLIEASSPLTELTRGLPFTARRAASRTSGFVESIWRGTSVTDWIALIVFTIIYCSSMPGAPTLTSRMSAPASTWETAWLKM